MKIAIGNLREFRIYLARVFRLIKPYWQSDQKRIAWVLLILVLAIEGGMLYFMTKLSFAFATLFNALDAREAEMIWHTFAVWFGYVFALLAFFAAQVHVQNKLIIHWRRFLTDRYLTSYLDRNLFNQLELGDYRLDNPDQRISMDMLNIAQETLELSLKFISTFGRLIVFSTILWTVSGALEFTAFGLDLVIPGYMFWIALIYAVIGTWLAHRLAHPMGRLNFEKQAVEADFRYHLVRLRENAESIALLDGEADESRELKHKFDAIWANWMTLLKYKIRLTAFDFGLGQLGSVVPYVVAIPALFAGTIALGGFMQLSQAFGVVQMSLTWFVSSYEKLAIWKSSVDRVLTFDDAIASAVEEQTSSDISNVPGPKGRCDVTGLTLRLPGGEVLLNDSSFSLESGRDVLISGPSGSGKSTLFRLLSGLWIWGSGNVSRPKGQTLFLPQRPYLPIASLRDVLTYPDAKNHDISAERFREILGFCRLEHLADRLDEKQDWSRVLSGGEQQRVSLARAFVAAPDWLFLDEATAAMDPQTEAHIYQALKSELPNTTLVSIAHRDSLKAFHNIELRLNPETRSLSVLEFAPQT